MNRRSRRRPIPWRAALAALAVSIGVAAAFVAFRGAPIASAIEGQTLDWRFRLRGPLPPPPEVAIIAIDDATVAAVNGWPLPRRVLADAVTRLRQAGAAVIGVDLLLVQAEPPFDGIVLSPGDRQLHDALRQAGNVVLTFAFTFDPAQPADAEVAAALERAGFRVVERPPDAGEPSLIDAAGALLPLGPFGDVATIGHANAPVDRDGALRQLPAALALGGIVAPAFPVEIARRFLGLPQGDVRLSVGRSLHLGTLEIGLDGRSRLPLNFYGPSGTVETYSFVDLIEGRIAPERMAGRIVLIGAAALGTGDTFVTPFSRNLRGVEVMATAVGNLLAGSGLRRDDAVAGWDLAAILGLGFVAFAASLLPSPAAAGLAAIGLLLGWGAVAQFAFESRLLWLNVTFPAASILLNAGIAASLRAVGERRLRRDAQRQRQNLSRFHSPVIADMLAQGDAASLGEREQRAAILFVDMAGSTQRAERLAPAETARFLREFHRRIEAAVLEHGGVLEQFTGDGAMVMFGVPTPREADAAAALAAAHGLIAAIHAWNRALAAQGEPPLAIRIGIHYGPVVIAALGGDAHRHLTAAGDTVNVASRLEALTRQHGAAIAVSGDVVAAVRAAGRSDLLAGFAPLPEQAIRGREERLAVWVAPAMARSTTEP